MSQKYRRPWVSLVSIDEPEKKWIPLVTSWIVAKVLNPFAGSVVCKSSRRISKLGDLYGRVFELTSRK